MTEEMLVFLESPHLTEVVERAKEMLASISRDVPFRLQGVVDVGSSHGPRIKRLLKIISESEWFAYKAVVLSLEVRSLDVLVVKDERPLYGVGMGHSHEVKEVVLTQPTYGGGDGWKGGVRYDYDYGGGGAYANDYQEEGGYRDDNKMSDDNVSYGVGEDEAAMDNASGDDAVDDDIVDDDDLSGKEGFGNARATNRSI
jgi:hypothetical protein